MLARMLTRALVFICGRFPALRRRLWQWWYDRLAREVESERWTFMNYGFHAPGSGAQPEPRLESTDEADRLCIQLYERVLGGIHLAGAKVLEVGSGRGGGASYVTRYHRPAAMVGLDYSGEAIRFCRARYDNVPGLNFEQGDAERLPMPDESFDAVINVESSHCYGDIRTFFAEVARVLKAGGHFLFADLRETREMDELKRILEEVAGLEIVAEEDVSKGVLKALEMDDQRKRALIESLIPAGTRPLFKEFAGVRGGQVFEGLRDGQLNYRRFVARKRPRVTIPIPSPEGGGPAQ